jgi:precorrin-6A/cobalt-precorrin-6A reductase
VGGFGDVDGLARFLASERIDRVVDATHPFATRITAHAVTACARVCVPLLVLRRGGWPEHPGDRWQRVTSVTQAAATVAAVPPGAVLLTIGRRDIAAFAEDPTHHYVTRSIDPPTGRLPPRHAAVLGRGPFTPEGERSLLLEHAVTVLVTRNSGGSMTAAKLGAARDLGLPVIMIEQPALPPGVPSAATLEGARAWLASAHGGTSSASDGARGDTGR